ncbi:unnamed protein product [Effrenium voratum]|nr:unnamed protein product [Effrenium voratum]
MRLWCTALLVSLCACHACEDCPIQDAQRVRAAPSLLTVSQRLQRTHGRNATKKRDQKPESNDDLAATLEDALQWEIRQLEKSLGEKGEQIGTQPSRVMGVAINGKDDMRTLKGALSIGSVGVLAVFLVFSVMRKLVPWVYIREADLELEPLEEATAASPTTAPRRFRDPHVTLFDWVTKVWQTTPEDELAQAGLDGWAFLEFRRLIWRIFSVIGPVLVAVLLPLHYQAHQGSDMDLDILSQLDIGRDPLPDWMLWVHAIMVWFVVCVSSWTVAVAQEHFTERRYQWLKEIPFPRANTILVRRTSRPCTARTAHWSSTLRMSSMTKL